MRAFHGPIVQLFNTELDGHAHEGSIVSVPAHAATTCP
jgi:hypothetical protein